MTDPHSGTHDIVMTYKGAQYKALPSPGELSHLLFLMHFEINLTVIIGCLTGLCLYMSSIWNVPINLRHSTQKNTFLCKLGFGFQLGSTNLFCQNLLFPPFHSPFGITWLGFLFIKSTLWPRKVGNLSKITQAFLLFYRPILTLFNTSRNDNSFCYLFLWPPWSVFNLVLTSFLTTSLDI